MSLENFKQCTMCRKPFQSFGGSICNSCLEQIEIDFRKIKDYLYENSGHLSVRELSKKTEVPEKVILHLMRDGRIEIRDNEGGLLCEVCKKPILAGTMCDQCKAELARSLDTSPKPQYEEKQPILSEKDSSKMHIGRNRRDG